MGLRRCRPLGKRTLIVDDDVRVPALQQRLGRLLDDEKSDFICAITDEFRASACRIVGTSATAANTADARIARALIETRCETSSKATSAPAPYPSTATRAQSTSSGPSDVRAMANAASAEAAYSIASSAAPPVRCRPSSSNARAAPGATG